jgi:hypothetical protein
MYKSFRYEKRCINSGHAYDCGPSSRNIPVRYAGWESVGYRFPGRLSGRIGQIFVDFAPEVAAQNQKTQEFCSNQPLCGPASHASAYALQAPSPHFSPASGYGRRCTTPSWVFSLRGARRTVKYDSAPLRSKTQLGAAPRRPRHETRREVRARASSRQAARSVAESRSLAGPGRRRWCPA